MKKAGLYLGLFASLLVISCKDKEEKTIETNDTNTIERVETETVVHDTVKAEDGTAVKVSGDGISVDSKDVDVEVKK
ncbi:hypothetical protein [Flavobacterium sp.]|uniref:hypothetical protein n=1 Tax=Flavobacterium sp. TaxID=239 RepID=UPI00260FD928|nr:hypothetical protein [Flavobacterium sp.]